MTHEYNWPETAQTAINTFSLVQKDGVIRNAIAVWVDNATVRFTSQDGRAGQMPLAAMDREATRALNSERGLALSLPHPETP